MRFKSTQTNLKIYAVTGTHTILLAFDMANVPNQFLGFAIERTQLDPKRPPGCMAKNVLNRSWRRHVPGQQYPTQLHPVQSFVWKDFYSRFPGLEKYTFKVTAVTGTPTQLNYSISASH